MCGGQIDSSTSARIASRIIAGSIVCRIQTRQASGFGIGTQGSKIGRREFRECSTITAATQSQIIAVVTVLTIVGKESEQCQYEQQYQQYSHWIAKLSRQ
jgi:hypothetical protein